MAEGALSPPRLKPPVFCWYNTKPGGFPVERPQKTGAKNLGWMLCYIVWTKHFYGPSSVVELPKKMSRSDYSTLCMQTQKKYVGPTIAAVEVSRSTRSHPIENVRPLFYSKSTMLNIVKSLIFFPALCSSRTKGILISLLTCGCSRQFHLRRGCRWTGSSAGAHEYHGP